MPNWCSNRVCIYGDENDLKKLKKHVSAENSDFSFQKILPCPTTDDDYSSYTWRTSNWGTKWDIDNNDIYTINDTPSLWEIEFDTAWAPPEGIYEELQDWIKKEHLVLDVTWFYHKPNCQITGYL